MAEKSPVTPLLPTYRVALDFLGDAWKEAYVELRDLPWSRTRELAKASLNVDDDTAEVNLRQAIGEAFVSGKAPASDGSTMDLAADHLTSEYFSLEVLGTLFSYIIGAQSPKASMRSSVSTPATSTVSPTS